MSKFKVLVILVLISFKTFACLNGETKILKNEFIAYMDYRGLVPHGHNFFPKEYPAVIKQLDSLYKKTKDLDYLSDKGYLLIVLGNYNEAENLYLNIERIEPNRYSTASNLGTLYELMGENQKAYKWIKKSIEINPESHNSSEWLHLKILEAKIKNLQNVTGQFLIGTNFGTAGKPKTKFSKEEIDKLAKAIYFQVNERISFIEPKDKIIAILLFELGNLVQLKGEHENALQIYRSARTYGYDGDLIVARMVNSAQGKGEYYREKTIEFGSKLQTLRATKKGIDLDYVYQIETGLIILSVTAIILFLTCIVFFFKWRKFKRVNSKS
ncbi:tetratricopeptide repeat protein [Flavobacterium chungbukense]|uniref:Tetratricopeptide repeat protein n=1 Tax=Flavobacterium chungbukense TaxID=877464 RepID=A0ABP7XXJ6_9FLAO|nr:tetratricopeptide repeat protein [Flavobacterium chungbukense]MCC4921679.1 tetratricopeptide repeat protein [Flavobacterium chungbukense]